MGAAIHTGCSGWYYEHWRELFYPAEMEPRQWLGYYCRHFATVELNSTFYHLPRKNSVLHWRKDTPPGFRFAVKVHRQITHTKRLRHVEQEIKRLLHMLKPLEEHLGPLLFQLPPDLKKDLSLLEDLIRIHPRRYRYAIEFRHPSWESGELYELLARNNVAFCLSDYHHRELPDVATADFVYLRFHGSGSHGAGEYGEEELRNMADLARRYSGEGREVFLYFNNDAEGAAVRNALRLRELLKGAEALPGP